MKNNKDLTLTIPHAIMSLTNLGKSNEVNIVMNDDAIIIMKNKKTPTELFGAVKLMTEVSSDLTVALAKECGVCDGCFECINSCEVEDTAFDIVPETMFNAFLDSGVCLSSLLDLIEDEVIVDEE